MVSKLCRRVRKQDGFTLIELLVVVAILGILAAVVTPRVLNALDNAKESAAEAIGKQIQLAMERLYVDEGEYPGDSSDAEDVVDALVAYVSLDKNNIDFAAPATDYDYTAAAGSAPETYTLTLVLKNPAKTVTITPTSVDVD